MLFEQIIEVLDPEPHAAALNMALDEVLLRQAEKPTLRVYGWRGPAVSFGYFGNFATAHCAAAGREMVRRWTGGGLVEHGADVTYTLVVPRSAGFFQHSALESYRLIHERIAQWLAGRGVAAAVAPGAAGGHSGACFAGHVRYDLVMDGGKVAGAAQRRTRWGLLHQGSIQVPCHAVGDDGGSRLFPLQGAAKLAEVFADDVQQTEIAPAVHRAAEQIARDKYATNDWLRKF